MDDPRAGLLGLLDGGALATLGDADLLDRFEAGAGDPAGAERAFEAIVRRHGGMVLRVARARAETEADARDAFQATFALLALRSRSIRRREALGAWLFGVAGRVAARARADAIRRRVRERRAAVPEADPALDPAHPDHDPDLAPAVRAEVERLPKRHRAAVVLCDLEGLPVAEAARRLGCAPGTVKSWASRGRARLRSRLVDRGLAPADWESHPLIVPLALVRSTCHLGRLVRLAGAARPPIAGPILNLIQGATRTMWLSSVLAWAASALLAATAGAVALTQLPGAAEAPTPPRPVAARPPAPAPADPLPPLRREAFRRAVAAIEADPDPDDRADSLIAIGLWLARQGDRPGARVVLDRAYVVMDTAPAGTKWTTPHPMLRLAEAWAEVGDRPAMHRAFERFRAIIVALPGLGPLDQYKNAFPVMAKLGDRAAIASLAAAYRVFLEQNPEHYRGLFGWIEATWATAFEDWDEAAARAGNPPRFRRYTPADLTADALAAVGLGRPRPVRPGPADLTADALVAIARVLRPADTVGETDARLDRVLAAVLARAPGLRRTSDLLDVMTHCTRLGRLERAEELGDRIGLLEDVRQGGDLGNSHRFNLAQRYDALASAWNRAGRPERALADARRALEIVPSLERPGHQTMPFVEAVKVLIDAGADDEARRVVEAAPLDVVSADFLLELLRAVRNHDPALLDRWRALGIARARQELDEAGRQEPPEAARIARLTQALGKITRYGTDAPPDPVAALAALPEAERAGPLGDWVRELARRDRIGEALALIDGVASPEDRRGLLQGLVYGIPAPTPPAASGPQSPRSEAAR